MSDLTPDNVVPLFPTPEFDAVKETELKQKIRREISHACARIPSDQEIEGISKIMVKILFHLSIEDKVTAQKEIEEIKIQYPNFILYFEKKFKKI